MRQDFSILEKTQNHDLGKTSHPSSTLPCTPPYEDSIPIQHLLCMSCWPQHKCFLFLFFFWPCLVAYGILVPWLVMEPMNLAFEARNLNHWTTGEIPEQTLLCIYFLLLFKAHVFPFKHSKIWGTFYFCLQMVTLSRHTWFLTQCLF